MEKYVIIALVLLCVFLGAYAAGLQRKLAKANDKCLTLKVQKRFVETQKGQDEIIYGVMEIKHNNRIREIELLKQQLRIAKIRLAHVRNRLRSK